jgi:hypothetical protein
MGKEKMGDSGEDILDRKSRRGREAVAFFLMVCKKVGCVVDGSLVGWVGWYENSKQNKQ